MLKQFFSILFITLVSANDYPYPLLNKRDPENKNGSPRKHDHRHHRHHHTRSDYYTRYDYL